MTFEIVSRSRAFGGSQLVCRHDSRETGTPMRFAAFVPPQAEGGVKVPVVWFLSGLTCTEENFTVKAGAQRVAAELGLMLVAPDTSPRGEGVPDDPEGAYDFGLGAGFYVDATEEPWAKNYRMRSYVETELPALVARELPADMDRQGITGHSMGGHGARHHRPARSRTVQGRVRLRAHRLAHELPVGREGALRLSWPGPLGLAPLRCLRAHRGRGATAGDPRGPGHGGHLP
jgi:Predicted esterase